MADFGDIIDKFIAILLAIFEALSPDLVSRNINSVDNSFAGFGDYPTTAPPVVLPALLDRARFPDFSSNVCETVFCTDYSESVLSSLQVEVDPCDNFYEFACGRYSRPSTAGSGEAAGSRPGSVLHSVTAQLRNRTLSRIRGLLETDGSADIDSLAVAKARQIYKACLNQYSMNTNGLESLRGILNQILGGWPLITPNWNASAFDLYRSLAAAKSLGFDAVFHWNVIEHPDDPTRSIINLGEAVLGLASPDFYNSDNAATIRQAYRDLIGSVAALIAGDNSTDRTLDIRDLADFERNLANATVPKNDSTSKNLFTINAFVRQYEPSYRLGRELLNLFKNVLRSVGLDSAVSGSSTINVENLAFYPLLGSQLASEERLGSDGKTVLANYIGWNIVFTQLPLLSASFRNALQTFGTAAGVTVDLTGGVPRWQECTNFVNEAMGNAVGNLYVKKFVPPESKEKVIGMIAQLKAAALQYVNQTSWLDSTAKSAASDKIMTVSDYVGYPDFIVNNVTLLDMYYDDITATGSHFENVQTLSRFAVRQELRKLGQLNGRSVDNETVPVTVNAFYYYDRNLIALFAGLMQSPLFDVDAPDYVNYAGIGYLYANKMANIFDEQGSKLNGSGFPTSGWSAATTTAYRTLVNNLRSQYRSFPPTKNALAGVTLDASDLLGDNLAVQFIMAAYRANHTEREAALPKLEQFTPDMQLLLSFAQNWCETGNSTEGSRTPSSYPKNLRVNVPILNTPDFNEIFKCDVNSLNVSTTTTRKVSLF